MTTVPQQRGLVSYRTATDRSESTYCTRCFLLLVRISHCGSWDGGYTISAEGPDSQAPGHALCADLIHFLLATDTTEVKACLVSAGRCFGVAILLPNVGRAWKKKLLGRRFRNTHPRRL